MKGRILPLVLLALGAVYLTFAYRITLDPWSSAELVNSRTLPIAYGAILILLSAILLVRRVQVNVPRKNLGPFILISVSIICFGLLLPWVGVWPALTLLLVSCLLIMEERRWHIVILTPLLTSLGGWLLIEILLGIYVEPGLIWT